jgi:integrase
MAVSKYEKDGKTFWQVYISFRSTKVRRARVQKRLTGIESEKQAYAEEKRLIRELSEALVKEESRGSTWGEVVERWITQQETCPTVHLAKTTLVDYKALLRNWTDQWWNTPASELNRADGRDILKFAKESGRSIGFRKRLKYKINMVFKWGIEERLINGIQESPVYGLSVEPEREEKRPEILTIEEIRSLLKKAREQKHPWYPVWVGAVLTGCRSGELHELRKGDLDLISREQAIEQDKKSFDQRRYGFIRVRRSWNIRAKEVGPTKAGYWRTVPISSEFYWFLVHDLKVETKRAQDYIFPRFWEWTKGEQARILRAFCISNQIPSIKFHTLRACFATQLISTGIPATTVMKICGWRDFKTMQRYIRFAGIDEAGATESLRFIPTEEAVMEKVISMYNYREE